MLLLQSGIIGSGGVDPTGIDAAKFYDLVVLGVRWALGLIGILVFIYILWAGLQYIFAGGNEGNQAAAKKAIQSAIIGLIIVIGAFTLMNTLLQRLGCNGTISSDKGSICTLPSK